ncbi:hypothetical protein MMC11_006382 [Xylographa trunciseda]|nr:hypothetical protein [Xylographa trunciseda]
MVAMAKTFVVEHLDPELGPWSSLEYQAIAAETAESHSTFCLSSVSQNLALPKELRDIPGLLIEHRSVEEIYELEKDRVCLLDPAAPSELCADDAALFDIFLFGGILGDDPPRDRTAELRQKGFKGRRLGPVQMTTDTAARVTRLVIQHNGNVSLLYVTLACSDGTSEVALDKIPYIDYPELKIDEHESTQLPFRYVKDDNGKPIMPKGMIDLIKLDSEKGFGDLF